MERIWLCLKLVKQQQPVFGKHRKTDENRMDVGQYGIYTIPNITINGWYKPSQGKCILEFTT